MKKLFVLILLTTFLVVPSQAMTFAKAKKENKGIKLKKKPKQRQPRIFSLETSWTYTEFIDISTLGEGSYTLTMITSGSTYTGDFEL